MARQPRHTTGGYIYHLLNRSTIRPKLSFWFVMILMCCLGWVASTNGATGSTKPRLVNGPAWIAEHSPFVGSYTIGNTDDIGEIIGKVISAKVLGSGLPPPSDRSPWISVEYTVHVIFSNLRAIRHGQSLLLSGLLTATPVVYSNLAEPSDDAPTSSAIIIHSGAILVASVEAVNAARGKPLFTFVGDYPTVLPIGLADPSLIAPNQVKPLELALRAWSEARRSSFRFSPYVGNVLPTAQASLLMRSRNFYLWAFGVSSFCGGANRSDLTKLIKNYLYPTKSKTIRQRGSPVISYHAWQRPRLSLRRAAWLVYAAAAYPMPWSRLTGWSAMGLIEDYLYRQSIPHGKEFSTLPSPWVTANLQNLRLQPMLGSPWAYENQGICLFPPGPGTPPSAGYGPYGPALHNASVGKFLKSAAFLMSLPPAVQAVKEH